MLLFATALAACGVEDEPRAGGAFVRSSDCAGCHPEQYTAWSGSHHDLAMQLAEDDTVLGDFDDSLFTRFGVTSRFFRKGERFFVNTEGPDGQTADFEIRYTFGVEPLQQYLIERPGGRLQALTIAWDTEKGRWFDLYPDEKIAHDDPLHWTGLYQSWNAICAECHSTDLRKQYDPSSEAYETTWAEIDVSCQACHGPARAHVEWARALPEGGAPESGDVALLVDFRAGDSRYEVDACARCHSRRHRVSAQHEHGRPFLDDFMPEVLRADLYHADGQILSEVYVYGSFLQSKMYLAGVSCSDCHDPHSLKPRAEGNALCVECHQERPSARFPTLAAKDYDTPEHHFHPAGSEGAACVGCHMPARTYMVVDPRRDHSFRVPRPDLSVKLGTPNACNDCHTDRLAPWAAEAVAGWYGPERRQGSHYAEAIAAGRARAGGAASALIELAGDPEQPAIVRATALHLLPLASPEAAGVAVRATTDDDPLVRAAAVRILERLAPKPRLASVAPLLTDPIRAVRIEAARVLASVPSDRFDPVQRRAFEAALGEYIEAQRAQADLPSAHLNLAVIHASTGRLDLAEKAYRTAIRLDPYFLPAQANLAQLYAGIGRNAEAEKVLRDAIQRTPREGELHYSLGLLLSEEARLDLAAAHLGQAAELLPGRARVHYNHGLALQQLGRLEEAEVALLEAHRIDPRDPEIIHAVAVLYVQQGRWEQAQLYVDKLIERVPEAPEPRQLRRRIQAELAAGREAPSLAPSRPRRE